MSADSFYRVFEKEMKSMDKVVDFDDFVECVKKVGDVFVMQAENFYDFENGLSESQKLKNLRPLLSKVLCVEFRKGSDFMFYKLK